MKKIYKKLAVFLAIAQLFCVAAVAAGAESGTDLGIKIGDTPLLSGIYYHSPDGKQLEQAAEEPSSYITWRMQDGAVHIVMKDFSIELENNGTPDPTYAGLYVPVPVIFDVSGKNVITNKGYVSTDGVQKFSIGLNLNGNGAFVLGDGSLAFFTNTDSSYDGYGYGEGTGSLWKRSAQRAPCRQCRRLMTG